MAEGHARKPVSLMFIACEKIFEGVTLPPCGRPSLSGIGYTAQQCPF
jgi:hypothetical protein